LVKFILWLLITAAFILGVFQFALMQGWISQKPSFSYATVFLLTFVTAVIYRYLYKLSSPEFFVQLYLLLMVVKLIAFLGYNVFMVLKDKPGAAANVIFFLIGYLIFTALEIVFLYQHVNTKSNP
jgi:hypothetical protein